MRFFDQYDAFYRTTQMGSDAGRLESRHAAIIARNADLLRGKRVLDIASHDGRWSFAALKAGSAHVTGVEPRRHLVEAGIKAFQDYRIDPDSYRFVVGDIFDVLSAGTFEFDAVLLLGFLYHVHRHVELASLVARTGAECVIVDTNIISDDRLADENCVISVMEEVTDYDGNAVGLEKTVIVGHPSRAAVRLIFSHFGYAVEEIDWKPYLNPDAELSDYVRGARATFVMRQTTVQSQRSAAT